MNALPGNSSGAERLAPLMRTMRKWGVRSAAGGVVVLLAWAFSPRPAEEPRPSYDALDAPGLISFLQTAAPDLLVNSGRADGKVGQCFYLTTRPMAWEEVAVLPVSTTGRERWVGVVLVSYGHDPSRNPGWLRRGAFWLFGDQQLLDRLDELLLPR
jgi:hypothetical protein